MEYLVASFFINHIFLTDQPLYLDPGSGSFLFQMLLATLVGALFAIKIYWKKITSFFNTNKSKNDNSKNDPGEPDEQ
jgi:hypothetical protein